ncbi:MAG TPA: hypothetical protein VIX89_17375 [Bryobacteraceae bacterium]
MRKIASLSTGLILTVFALSAIAQEAAKPSLTGTWQFDAAKSELHGSKMTSATWVIDEGDNSIHLTETEGGKNKKIEMQCTTDGKECQVTGDKSRASFWYNGPILVEMQTKGDTVTRFKMKASEDGKTLTVELTHIVPQNDKSDLMVFQKQ